MRHYLRRLLSVLIIVSMIIGMFQGTQSVYAADSSSLTDLKIGGVTVISNGVVKSNSAFTNNNYPTGTIDSVEKNGSVPVWSVSGNVITLNGNIVGADKADDGIYVVHPEGSKVEIAVKEDVTISEVFCGIRNESEAPHTAINIDYGKKLAIRAYMYGIMNGELNNNSYNKHLVQITGGSTEIVLLGWENSSEDGYGIYSKGAVTESYNSSSEEISEAEGEVYIGCDLSVSNQYSDTKATGIITGYGYDAKTGEYCYKSGKGIKLATGSTLEFHMDGSALGEHYNLSYNKSVSGMTGAYNGEYFNIKLYEEMPSVKCTDFDMLKGALESLDVVNVRIEFSEPSVVTEDDLNSSGYFIDVAGTKNITIHANMIGDKSPVIVDCKGKDYKGLIHVGNGTNITLNGGGSLALQFKQIFATNGVDYAQNTVFVIDGGGVMEMLNGYVNDYYKTIWEDAVNGPFIYPITVYDGTFIMTGGSLKATVYGREYGKAPQTGGVINICSDEANVTVDGGRLVLDYAFFAGDDKESAVNEGFTAVQGTFFGSGIASSVGYDYELGYKRANIVSGEFAVVESLDSEKVDYIPIEEFEKVLKDPLLSNLANESYGFITGVTSYGWTKFEFKVNSILKSDTQMAYNDSTGYWEMSINGITPPALMTDVRYNDIYYASTTYPTDEHSYDNIKWEYSEDGVVWRTPTVANTYLNEESEWYYECFPSYKVGKDVYYRVTISDNESALDELSETVLVHYASSEVSSEVTVTYENGLGHVTPTSNALIKIDKWIGLVDGEIIPSPYHTARLEIIQAPANSNLYGTYLYNNVKSTFKFPEDFISVAREFVPGAYIVRVGQYTSTGRWVYTNPIILTMFVPAEEMVLKYDVKRYYDANDGANPSYHAAGFGRLNISANVLPSTASIELYEKPKWVSSNPEVVEATNSGNLLALKPGKATLTASSESFSPQSVDVTVPVCNFAVTGLEMPVYGQSFDTTVEAVSDIEVTPRVTWENYASGQVDATPKVGCRYWCEIEIPITGYEVPLERTSDGLIYADKNAMNVSLNGEYNQAAMGVTGYRGYSVSDTFDSVTLYYLTDAIVNPDAKEIDTIYVNYNTTLYHGDKKSDWENAASGYCVGDGNSVLTLDAIMSGFTSSAYIIGGDEYEAVITASLSGDAYTFAEKVTWVINGVECEQSRMTKTFCMAPTAKLTAVGQPNIMQIEKFVPTTINIAVGETVNIADYYTTYPASCDAKFSYSNSEYFEPYYTVDSAAGTVTGVAPTDGYYSFRVIARYTDTLSDGTECSFSREYAIQVNVYEKAEDKPATYTVSLDGVVYKMAAAGEKVCVYVEDSNKALTGVSCEGLDIVVEENNFNMGYDCWTFTMPAHNVDLVGEWNVVERYYKVQFKLNAVGEKLESQTVLAGSKLVEPVVPEVTGATFGGWYKDEECTQAWDFDTDTVSDNITLYALWIHSHTYTAAIIKPEAMVTEGNCSTPSVYYYSCLYCGEVEGLATHTFEGSKIPDKHVLGPEATLTTPQVCTLCGYVITPALGSETPVEAFVERMYTVALDRASDAEGKANWVTMLNAGSHDGAGLAKEFILGAEFALRGLSDEQYVDTLYATFFNREADEGGRNLWLAVLASGQTREFVLSNFVNLPEFTMLCESYGIERGVMLENGEAVNPGIPKFVKRLYTTVLGRPAENEGLYNNVLALVVKALTAEEAAKNFFGSEEYLLKGKDTTSYVRDLYAVFMDREADEAGLSFWVDCIDVSGMTREQALTEFAGSEEFKIIAARYGLE